MSTPTYADFIRTIFLRELRQQRQELLIFSLISVLFIPLALALMVAIATFVVTIGIARYLGGAGLEGFTLSNYNTGFNMLMASLLLVVLVTAQSPQQLSTDHSRWKLAAALTLLGMLLLSYATDLLDTQPVRFWLLYLGLVFVMLALLGRVYTPHASHYSILQDINHTLGNRNPWSSSTRRNQARTFFSVMRLSLATLTALADFILSSYAAIFNSRWLWKGLARNEQILATSVLVALAQQDNLRARNLLSTCSPQIANALLEIFDRLNLVKLTNSQLVLTIQAEQKLVRAWYQR